jgi:hypothetical protein
MAKSKKKEEPIVAENQVVNEFKTIPSTDSTSVITAMEVKGIGCVVRVSTTSNGNVSEALTFVPSSKLVEVEGKAEIVSLFDQKR